MKILNLLTLAVVMLFGITSNMQAQCTVSFTSTANGNTVNFTSSSSGASSPVYVWTISNSNMSQTIYGANPTFTFNASAPNINHVCLTMYDSIGNCQATYCDTVFIANGNPCAGFGASYSYSVTGNSISFTSSTTGGAGTYTYSWSFGNGTTSSSANPTTQLSSGWHSVCLTVSDSNCTYTYCDSVYVSGGGNTGSPCSTATASYQYYVDSVTGAVNFFSTQSGFSNQNVSYSWTSGNGNVSYGANPSIQLPAGWHSVCLTVSDSNCTYTYCDSVYVPGGNTGNPCSTATASYQYYIDSVTGAVNFFSTQSGFSNQNVSYSWTSGNGNVSYGANPSIQLPAGWHSVCLTVSDSNCTYTYCDSVYVPGGNTGNPCNQNEVTLVINLDNYASETSWDLTDASGAVVASGSGYTLNNTVVTQALCLPTGCYNFTIYDSYGDGICCAYGQGHYSLIETGSGMTLASGGAFTYSESTNICVGGASNPCGNLGNSYFTYSVGANGAVTFTPQITGNLYPMNYSWDFGGGNTSSAANPTFVFSANGYYLVCMTADSAGCTVTYCDTVFVSTSNGGNQTGPCSTLGVNINITQDSTNPFLLWMQPVVTGAAPNAQFTFVWDFGDNTGGFSGSPTHMYNNYGSYVVCIMALDNSNGCVATFCDTITIDSSGNFSRNATKPSFWVNTLPPVIQLYSGVDVVEQTGLAINLFPNPANNIVNLDIRSEDAIDGAVSILDVTGKTVYNQAVNVAAGQQQVSLSVDQLPAGMYLVQLVSGNTQKTMKFIKE